MKVTDHIKDAAGTLVSFEVLPPLKGKGIDALYRHLDPLMAFNPAYINVTYHRSEHVFKKRTDGSFEKVVVRKRPGTEAICAAIMNKYNVDTVPHIICGGFSLQDTEVVRLAGVQLAPHGVPARHPAFDITPARLVTAIITDAGVARAPYADSLRVLEAAT